MDTKCSIFPYCVCPKTIFSFLSDRRLASYGWVTLGIRAERHQVHSLLFLCDCQQNWNVSASFSNSPISDPIRTRSAGQCLSLHITLSSTLYNNNNPGYCGVGNSNRWLATASKHVNNTRAITKQLLDKRVPASTGRHPKVEVWPDYTTEKQCFLCRSCRDLAVGHWDWENWESSTAGYSQDRKDLSAGG
jgi:hypothetical protein